MYASCKEIQCANDWSIIACIVEVRINLRVQVEHLRDVHIFSAGFVLPVGKAKICKDAVWQVLMNFDELNDKKAQ